MVFSICCAAGIFFTVAKHTTILCRSLAPGTGMINIDLLLAFIVFFAVLCLLFGPLLHFGNVAVVCCCQRRGPGFVGVVQLDHFA